MTAKKSCCKDKPRCKACPVTLMRLERLGYAERESKRAYQLAAKVPKKAVRAARAR